MTTAEKLRLLANSRGVKEQFKRTNDAIKTLEIALNECMGSGINIKNKSKLVISIAKVLVQIRILEHIVGDKPINGRIKFELEKQLKEIGGEDK